MRFQPATLENVEFLKAATGIENRTLITATAIALAKGLIERQMNGGTIYVEWPDGKREPVAMQGFPSLASLETSQY